MTPQFQLQLTLADVENNIKTISSQLDAVETKYRTLSARDPQTNGGSELPLTEIMEELDLEGNVVCTSSVKSATPSALLILP